MFDIQKVCPLCYEYSDAQSETDGNGYPVKELCEKCIARIKNSYIEKINQRGDEYLRFTFDNFKASKENQKQVSICKQFANREIDRFGLWLYSPNAGNGKTHLAIATMKHWILNTYKPKVDSDGRLLLAYADISEPELLLKIRSSYRDGSREDEDEILSTYKEAEFLVLDDVGKTNANDLSFLQRTMYTIIDYRSIRHKLTVITSNKNGAELQQYLGLYTFDRIKGMSQKVTEIFGESWRGKNG